MKDTTKPFGFLPDSILMSGGNITDEMNYISGNWGIRLAACLAVEDHETHSRIGFYEILGIMNAAKRFEFTLSDCVDLLGTIQFADNTLRSAIQSSSP
jgi:hypothetical protein